MPSSGKPPRQIALYRLACPAVNPSIAARCQPSADRNRASMSIPHAFMASPVEGLVTKQCSAAQYGATQSRPQRTHAARTNTMQPSTRRARWAMQIRPESRCIGLAESPYIHHAQRIARAASGHFKRFSGFPVNARQCSAAQSRPPPEIDTLRLCAVGVKFSQNFR